MGCKALRLHLEDLPAVRVTARLIGRQGALVYPSAEPFRAV
jgi:hypothetical protein